MLLLLVLGSLAAATARADGEPILPGSYLKVEEAVAKSDVVFEAKLTRAGEILMKDAAKYVGPTYTGAQATGASFYKGHAGEPVHLSIFVHGGYQETVPVVGQSYLFFVSGPRAGGEYEVMKMLLATKENRRTTLRAFFNDSAQKKQALPPPPPPSAA